MESIDSAAKNGDNVATAIIQSIEDEIAIKARDIQKKYQDQIVKELFELRGEVVAKAAIRIAKQSSIQYLNDRIVVEIIDRRTE